MSKASEVIELMNEVADVDKLRLKIAKETLKMSDQGALLMGGMTKEEARRFLKKNLKWSDKKIAALEK